MAFLASLLPSLIPSLLGSGGGGGILKTVADIGKDLIVPVGTKLLQAASGFLGGDKSSGQQAIEAVKEGGRELVQRGMQRIMRRPIPEPIEEEYEELPPPPPKRKRRPQQPKSKQQYQMQKKIKTPQYDEYEGVGDMFNEHRDYEA